MLRRIIGATGVALVLAALLMGTLAYYVKSHDATGMPVNDGLGRELLPVPTAVRFLFTNASTWAGWTWFLADFALFFGALFGGYRLASWGFHEPDPSMSLAAQ